MSHVTSTYIATCKCKDATYICQCLRLLKVKSILPNLPATEPQPDDPENEKMGAADDKESLQKENAKRGFKVYKALTTAETPVLLASMFLTCRLEDKLIRGLQSPPDICNPRPAGQNLTIFELTDVLSEIQHDLADLLDNYGQPDHITTIVFSAAGISQEDMFKEDNLLVFRRQVMLYSVGNSRRLEKKLVELPLAMSQLVDEDFDEIVRDEFCDWFLGLDEDDCLPLFCRIFRRNFPTKVALKSAAASLVVHQYLKSLVFTIYRSEKGHASFKIACASKGPAANCDYMGDTHVLRQLLAVHTRKGLVHPLDSKAREGKQRGGKRGPAVSPTPTMHLNPWEANGTPPAAIEDGDPSSRPRADDASAGPHEPRQAAQQGEIVPAPPQPHPQDRQKKASGRGGCPLRSFQNCSLHSLKQMGGPELRTKKGTLKQHVVEDCRAKCKKQFEADADLRKVWKEKYALEVQERQTPTAKAPTAKAPTGDTVQESHWAGGTRSNPLGPKQMMRTWKDRYCFIT